MEKQIVLTRESYDAKVKELEQLKTTGRDEIAERIKVARSFGDLSENSEYDDAKNEQAIMEARIATIESILKTAQIIDESETSNDKVHLTSVVTIEMVGTDRQMTYKTASNTDSCKEAVFPHIYYPWYGHGAPAPDLAPPQSDSPPRFCGYNPQ